MSRISCKLVLAAGLTLAALFGEVCAFATTVTATWDGAAANWSAGTHWSSTPLFPNNSAPTTYLAVISTGTVTLDQPIVIDQLQLSGGTLNGVASLTGQNGLLWTGGTIAGNGLLSVGNGGASTLNGSASPLRLTARHLVLQGATTFTSGSMIGGAGAVIDNTVGATFTAEGTAAFLADFSSPAYTFHNAGTFISHSTSGLGFTSMDAQFNNSGTVRVEALGTATGHTLSLAGGGSEAGTFQLGAMTTVELGDGTTLQTGTAFVGAGTAVVAGAVTVTGDIAADNLTLAAGRLETGVHTVTVNSAGSQTGGLLHIAAGGKLQMNPGGVWTLDYGALTGSGTLAASLNAQGEIAPGDALGTLSITGSTVFGSDALLRLEIGGSSAGSYDLLAAGGSVTLDGAIHLTLANGFQPTAGQSFTILTGAAVSGAFANAPVSGAWVDTDDGLGSFRVIYGASSVTLTSFIPEPSVGLLAMGGCLFFTGRHRRTQLT